MESAGASRVDGFTSGTDKGKGCGGNCDVRETVEGCGGNCDVRETVDGAWDGDKWFVVPVVELWLTLATSSRAVASSASSSGAVSLVVTWMCVYVRVCACVCV